MKKTVKKVGVYSRVKTPKRVSSGLGHLNWKRVTFKTKGRTDGARRHYE